MPLVRFRYNMLRIFVGTSNIIVKLLALNNNYYSQVLCLPLLVELHNKENTGMHILYSALLFTCSSHTCDA